MRKRLLSLTNEDLETHPIWLYDGPSDSDALVHPVDSFAKPDSRAYIARTKFTLRDGTVMFGYCSPTDASGLDYIQPVIITASDHVPFWHDPPESVLSDEELAALLGRSPDDVFPCRFESLVPFNRNYLIQVVAAATRSA